MGGGGITLRHNAARKVKGQGILGTPMNNVEPWPSTYHIHKKVPKYWLGHWLAQGIKEWADPELVNLVDDGDTAAVRKLVEFATGITQYHPLPSDLHNKLILSRWLSWQHRQLGTRLADVFENHVEHQTGVVHWERFPDYSWVPHPQDPTSAQAVRHISGVEALLVQCWALDGGGRLEERYVQSCGSGGGAQGAREVENAYCGMAGRRRAACAGPQT